MKRILLILGMALVLTSGLSSCAVEAYPGGYYYGYGHPYWGPWHGGYYHGYAGHYRGGWHGHGYARGGHGGYHGR